MILEKTKRDEMISANLGLVHSCAHKMTGRGVEYDDLFQAGCVGLIKAVDGFDDSRGFSFSTYAVPVILGEIKRIFRDGGTVSVSRSLKEKGRKISYERERFVRQFDREPTVRELADRLGFDEYETAQAITASMPVISMTQEDTQSGDEFDIPVGSPEEDISTAVALEQVMNNLNERDREIIRLRYFSGLTQTVIAKQLGMTQVQVSRREKAILKSMRSNLL
ncbi:MAG: sigma-70 family RNA polymerase sigma factor [Clostridia bacterium]|nr:sigma-70 family RNA polymerase sigma factor [Clostridia bacterium]